MSKIANLTAAIARKAQALQYAREHGDEDEIEDLEAELYDLEDELEAEEERMRDSYDDFV